MGLPDFNKLTTTVLKLHFPKLKLQVVKDLRKTPTDIMKRSKLKIEMSRKEYKKQRNFCINVLKKAK